MDRFMCESLGRYITGNYGEDQVEPIDYGICPRCNGQGCYDCRQTGEVPIYPEDEDQEEEKK